MGDRLIIRALIQERGKSLAPRVLIKAFAYYCDAEAYMGLQVHMSTVGVGRGSHIPIAISMFPEDRNDWEEYIAEQISSWRGYAGTSLWHECEEVVTTREDITGKFGVLPPSHPQVLYHLTRFQGALEMAYSDPAATLSTGIAEGTGQPPRVPISAFNRVLLGIVLNRVEGINKASIKKWEQLLG